MKSTIKKYRFHALIVLLLTMVVPFITLVFRGTIILPQVIDLRFAQFRIYGLCIALAVVAVCLVLSKLAKRDLPNLDIWTGLVWVLIPGLIFARVYHVVTDWSMYANNLRDVFSIWNGGMSIIGGIVGGALGVLLFSRRDKLNFTVLLGLLAVAMPLGQAVGRLGNLFNYELYGPPTELPWGIFIPQQFRLMGFGAFSYYHPLFLYELLGSVALFTFQLWLWRRGTNSKLLVLNYLIGYGTLRFLLEFMRLNGNAGWAGLTYTQWLLVVTVPLLSLLAVMWYKQGKFKN